MSELAGVDIGRCEDELAESHAGPPLGLARDPVDRTQHGAVAHAVRDHVHPTRSGLECEGAHVVRNHVLVQFDRCLVGRVHLDFAPGCPTEERHRALDLQIEPELCRTRRGLLEVDVEPVHEDNGVPFFFGAGRQAFGDALPEGVFGGPFDREQAQPIKERLGDEHGAAGTYHQLGMVAEERRDFEAAEGWYRKSLEITERLGDEPGAAGTYHQLGMVAEERRDFEAAEGWYRKSLEISERLRIEHYVAVTRGQLQRLNEEQRRGPAD